MTQLTLIDVALFRVLLGEWILHDDVLQLRLVEILFAWRLVRTVLDRILLH